MNVLEEKCYRVLETLAAWIGLEVTKIQEPGKLFLKQYSGNIKDNVGFYAIAMKVHSNQGTATIYPFGEIWFSAWDLVKVMDGMMLMYASQHHSLQQNCPKLNEEGNWEFKPNRGAP